MTSQVVLGAAILPVARGVAFVVLEPLHQMRPTDHTVRILRRRSALPVVQVDAREHHTPRLDARLGIRARNVRYFAAQTLKLLTSIRSTCRVMLLRIVREPVTAPMIA